MDHTRFMRVALNLARHHLGTTAPNPSVGAILVKNGQIIATGITAKGGRPHAETIAINNAGDATKNATLYVTLEPCSHHGKTAPCTDAIIAAGIKTVVIGCADSNPNVSGIAALKAANIEVIENICEREAREVNAGFFSVVEKKRPYVALKIATSMNGKITTGDAGNQWLTSEQARNYGHLLRAQHDAIATGIGTVLADDPQLNCRLAGLEERSPVRIVFDRKNRLPADAKINPVWQITSDIPDALHAMAQKNITRLLVEGGAELTAAFLESGFVDKIYWFRAPIHAPDHAYPKDDSTFARAMAKLAQATPIEHTLIGNDILDIYACSQE